VHRTEEEDLLKQAKEESREIELGEAQVDPNFKCPDDYNEFATATTEVEVATGVKLLVRTKDCKCKITAGAGCIQRACGPHRNQGYTSLFSAVPTKAAGTALTAAENVAAQTKIGERYKLYQSTRKTLSIAIQQSRSAGGSSASNAAGNVFGKLCTDAQAAASPVPAPATDNTPACQTPTGFTSIGGTPMQAPSHLKASQGCGTSTPAVNEWIAKAAPTQQTSLLDVTVIQTKAFQEQLKGRLIDSSACPGATSGFTQGNLNLDYSWYEEKVFAGCKVHTANQIALTIMRYGASSAITSSGQNRVTKLAATEATESNFVASTCPANADPKRL